MELYKNGEAVIIGDGDIQEIKQEEKINGNGDKKTDC
jgi:hypothetical protein